jgi:hypothetical protein
MIQVTVERQGSLILLIEISGHAESGPYGYDLVCAGVSAVSIGAVNAVMELSAIDLKVEQGGEGGYLKIAFPEMLLDNKMEKAQLLLEGMLVSLRSIENEYGEFIRIDDK